MQNNFPKVPFYSSLLALCILTTVFIFLYGQIKSNTVKSEQTMTEVEAHISKREEIRSLDSSLRAIQDDKTKLEQHFVASSDVVPFLDSVEAAAPKVDAHAQVISVDVAQDNSGLLVSLDVTGSFSGVYRFITILENFPYELEFESINMKQEAGAPVAADPSGKTKTPVVSSPKWEATVGLKLLSFTP